MDLDLRLVRYVVFVAEELHFGRAAARLHITQQTLSAQISKFESQLGVALFLRDRRHVELTSAGELFVAQGRRLLLASNDLLGQLKAQIQIVRVDTVMDDIPIAPLVTLLRDRLPGFALEFTHEHGLTPAIRRLLSADLDVAFGWVGGLSDPLPSALDHWVVMRDQLGLVLPQDHPLAGPGDVTMAELAEYPILLHTAREAVEWQRWNEAVIAEFGLRVGLQLHGHGREAANAAVVTYGFPSIGPLNTKTPSPLVVRRLVSPVPVYEWSMVWSVARRTEPATRTLLCIKEISADLDWNALPQGPYWRPAPVTR